MNSYAIRMAAAIIAALAALVAILVTAEIAVAEPSYPPCPEKAPDSGVSAYVNCTPNPDWL